MNRTILLAVDGTPSAGKAIDFLECYSGPAADTQVIVLNVQPRPAEPAPGNAVDPRSIGAAVLGAGERIAGAAASRLRAAGLQARSAVRIGLAAEEILDSARLGGAELIVMGTRGHGLVQGFALGSVALRVVHGGAIPVCILQPHTQLPAQLGRSLRVMLAVDGSAPCLQAARTLLTWGSWLGKLEVHLVHVEERRSAWEALPAQEQVGAGPWSSSAAASAFQPVADLLAAERLGTRPHLAVGEVAQAIVQTASACKCDLLVLGTRGLGAIQHAFLGSVALQVAALATIPVLLAGWGALRPRPA